MDQIQKRFDELEEQARSIDASRTHTPSTERTLPSRFSGKTRKSITPSHTDVNYEEFTKWTVSATEHIRRVFGADSPTAQSFSATEDGTPAKYKSNNAKAFDHLYAVFRSAKEQYEGGYLFDVERLVHASVFEDELEQAEYFLSGNFKTAAAVTAGVVLETTLRRLCIENGISLTDTNGKAKTLNPLNTDLSKANVYTTTRQKEITTWGGIRNDAAHGRPDNFDETQVKGMIDGVRGFISQQLS